MRHKVIYILPKFDNNTDTHFAYLYELIRAATNELDIVLLIERSDGDVAYFDGCTYVKPLNKKNAFSRLWSLFVEISKLRVRGYKKVYVHYSFYGALVASVIMRLSGGKVWYWNCGMPWLFGKQYMLQVVLKFVHYMVAGASSLFAMYHENVGLNPEKGRVLPTWIDIERFRSLQKTDISGLYDIPENKQIVLFVHHISKRKGAHLIVPVASHFKDNSDVHFVIAGSGPYFETMQREVEDQKLINITVLGKVPNKHIPALFAKAAVYFMPSNEEGYARTHLESIVAGVPAVVTNVGATSDALARHKGGVMCEPEDVECLASGIQNMISNPLKPQNAEMADQSVALKEFIKLFDE
ncbi:MAG: glycosyltransferase family 4 protein [Patescibacteria group bacterium]